MREMERVGYDLAMGVLRALWIVLLSFVVISFALKFFDYGIDDSDLSTWTRSGMELHTDYKTGLQYFSKDGAIIKRIDRNGNHMSIK